MWPFNKKNKAETENTEEMTATADQSVAAGIDWRHILSEGKCVEIFDGCKAKSEGMFGDL